MSELLDRNELAQALTRYRDKRSSLFESWKFKFMALLCETTEKARVVIDDKGIFLMTSEAFARKLGYEVGELIGRSYEGFIHPEDIEPSNKIIEMNLRGEIPVHYKFTNRYKDNEGNYRPVHWNIGKFDSELLLWTGECDIE